MLFVFFNLSDNDVPYLSPVFGSFCAISSTQLQDREVLVSLLVGAKYGMSQVINHKLNVISTLVEFSSISRVELLSESDKVSLLRISLHDMKVRKVLDLCAVYCGPHETLLFIKHAGIYTLTWTAKMEKSLMPDLHIALRLSEYRSFHFQYTKECPA